MKQEPEWEDIVAMIAMMALLSRPKNAQPDDIAYVAYEQAQKMIEEKDRRAKKV
jgi:hypothetical protein